MTSWTEAFAVAGVEVTSAEPCRMVLRHAGRSEPFSVHRHGRSPRLSELRPAPSPDALLVAPALTRAAQVRLSELGWSWATNAGQLHVRFSDHVVEAPESQAPTTIPTGGRVQTGGRGAFAVLRRLLLDGHMFQMELARSAGISQPRVSQILSEMVRQDLVRRDPKGWALTDWDAALDLWLASYPGPDGVATYWTGLDDVWSQTLAALTRLPEDATVSGDAGADLLAPWRRPARATLYASVLCDLSTTGLVQVTAREATLVTCSPLDRSVWPISEIARPFRQQHVKVADPLQVLWDVQRVHDSDSEQAAGVLRTWLRREYAPRAQP